VDIRTQELLDRTFRFGVNILKFFATLPDTVVFRIPKGQLAKASTSVGANYEEAQAAESKRDFIHKIGVVLKETRESHYWLRVLKAICPNPHAQNTLQDFIVEAEELKQIFTSIKLTAEQRRSAAKH
jgi:four helix bundle protein